MMDPILLVTTISAYIWFVKCTDKFINSVSAFSRGLTLNEFANIWSYKNLFDQ